MLHINRYTATEALVEAAQTVDAPAAIARLEQRFQLELGDGLQLEVHLRFADLSSLRAPHTHPRALTVAPAYVELLVKRPRASRPGWEHAFS